MAVLCGIVTVAIFQLIIGIIVTGFTGYIAILFTALFRDSTLFLIAFVWGSWMSLLLFGITTLVAGIIGCVAGCQRGQCVVMAYMASCVLCSLSSFEVIVIGALSAAALCQDGKDREICMQSSIGILSISFLACAAFMFMMSVLGSVFACKAKCYCCSSSEVDAENQEPNVMVLTTNPYAQKSGQINSALQ